jgi:superfamily II DNA or RNA helicase
MNKSNKGRKGKKASPSRSAHSTREKRCISYLESSDDSEDEEVEAPSPPAGDVKGEASKKNEQNGTVCLSEEVVEEDKVRNGSGKAEDVNRAEEKAPSALIGRTVGKEFADYGYFEGKVVAYNAPFFEVLYSDGDSEEYELAELQQLLLPSGSGSGSKSRKRGGSGSAAASKRSKKNAKPVRTVDFSSEEDAEDGDEDEDEDDASISDEDSDGGEEGGPKSAKKAAKKAAIAAARQAQAAAREKAKQEREAARLEKKMRAEADKEERRLAREEEAREKRRALKRQKKAKQRDKDKERRARLKAKQEATEVVRATMQGAVASRASSRSTKADQRLADSDSSDDEFARRHFILPSSDEESNSGGKRKSKNSLKVSKDRAAVSTAKGAVDLSTDDAAAAAAAGESDSDSDSDEEDQFRIQLLLGSKKLLPAQWREIQADMNTREINRGSAWEMEEEEWNDTRTEPIEKFLVKWQHASYLHVSWETTRDLLDNVGPSAKAAINRFRQREARGEALFDDLGRGEYFPPQFVQIDRVLDIEDKTIDVQTVDWATAPLPDMTPKLQGKKKKQQQQQQQQRRRQSEGKDGAIAGAFDEDVDGVSDEGDWGVLELSDDDDDQDEVSIAQSGAEDGPVSSLAVVPLQVDPVGDVPVAPLLPLATDAAEGALPQTDDLGLGMEIDVDEAERELHSIGDRRGLSSTTEAEAEVEAEAAPGPSSSSSKPAPAVEPEVTAVVAPLSPSIASLGGCSADLAELAGALSSPSPAKKKSASKRACTLHGRDAWLVVKWADSYYKDGSTESVEDLWRLRVEYAPQLRAFFAREQQTPLTDKEAKKVRRSLAPAADAYDAQAAGAGTGADARYIESAVPPAFPGGRELRDYQWEGVRWMLFNWSQRRNSILADEMGLGKTIQTAAFLQLLRAKQRMRGPVLVVCPLSVLVHWQREIAAWTSLDVVIYHGDCDERELIRDYDIFYRSRGRGAGHKCQVVVTTPETILAADSKTQTGRVRRALAAVQWSMLVVDEAHKLKNHASSFTRCLREDYSFTNCLLLSGTPLQNTTDELWTLLNFVDGPAFKSRERFIEEYGNLSTAGAEKLSALHKRIRPYLLRREKENVEKSVPPKEEIIVEVELTAPQKQYYRAIYEMNTNFLCKSGSKEMPSLTNLAMQIRLTCNHPFLVKGAETEIAKHFQDADSTYHHVDNQNVKFANLSTLVQASGKMVLLDKLLPKLKQEGHRVLIFSQFRLMLNILEDYLVLKGFSYERVDGTVTGKKRQAAIDKYTNPESGLFVMLLSTRAGGVGINLTAADTVIIYDSDWNPQNDLQAQARAHRIGQEKTVKVYRLLTRNSYEMHMFKVASMKLGLDYAVMHNMDGGSGDVTFNKQLTGFSTGADGGKQPDGPVTMSSMSKKELENLLKHGAYDIFRDDAEGKGDEKSRTFCDADIDELLKRSKHGTPFLFCSVFFSFLLVSSLLLLPVSGICCIRSLSSHPTFLFLSFSFSVFSGLRYQNSRRERARLQEGLL